jgi:transposase
MLKKNPLPGHHLLGTALFFLLFYFAVWPLVWHSVFLTHVESENHQLRVESYFPHRVTNTRLFLENPDSSQAQRWLIEQEDRIQVFWLPPYRPEFNPDENLNQDVKSIALGRRRPHTQDELVKNVRSSLYNRQQKPQLIKKYFHGETVRYALSNI